MPPQMNQKRGQSLFKRRRPLSSWTQGGKLWARIFKAKKLDRRRDQTIWNQLMSGRSLLDRVTLRRFGATELDRCPECDELHTAEHIMKGCQRGASLRHWMMGNAEPKDHFISNPKKPYQVVETRGDIYILAREGLHFGS